ncbi:hypothetical protein SKAU_G00319110, partial [Synaphobranchus kaupii]
HPFWFLVRSLLFLFSWRRDKTQRVGQPLVWRSLITACGSFADGPDMLAKLWSLVLYVYGLFQSLWPCPSPQLLSLHHLNTQQYVGTWYFIAAVGNRQSDISQFTSMDSTVFDLQRAKENGTLVITGAIRIGDSCSSKVWMYHVDPDKDYLVAEGWPNRRTLLWSGEWLNCPDCVMLQETDLGEIEDETNRILLYARNGSLSDSVVKDFQSKWSCLGMSEIFSLPQEKEYCPQGAAPV